MKRSFLLIMFLAVFIQAAGQNARLYLPETGLPNSQINRIYQDHSEYLWLCTEGGLIRFDGLRFETYRHERENQNSLASSSVIDMLEDRQGTKWVGTATGLDIFDSGYSSFTHFSLREDAAAQSQPYIGYLLEVTGRDDRNTLYVATGGSGLFVIDCASRQADPLRRAQIYQYLKTDFVHSLFLDASRRLWILPGEGLPVVLDADTLEPAKDLEWSPELLRAGARIRINIMDEDPLTGDLLLGSSQGLLFCKAGTGLVRKAAGKQASGTKAESLIFDTQATSADGRLFLVGNEQGGFLHFDTETEEVRLAVIPSIRQDSSNWKVADCARDSQGNLWFSLYQTGLLVAPRSMFGFSYMGFSSRNRPGENNAVITSVYEDGQTLWVATDGAGLFARPAGNGRSAAGQRNFTRDNSALTNNSIMAVTGDRYGTIWVGTYLDGLYYLEGGDHPKRYPDGARLGTERIRTLAYDPSRDYLYVGTYGAGLSVIDVRTRKLVARQVGDDYRWVSALHLDSSGVLWVGTYNGPHCYDPAADRIVPYKIPTGSDIPYRIYSICSSPDGTLWFGTEEGLFQVDGETRQVHQYTEQDGLASNVVRDILCVGSGDVWVATSSGLSQLSPRSGKIASYKAYDGLQGNEFRSGAAFRAPSGRLYFGGNGGLTSFSPLLIGGGERRMSQVTLARLTLLDREVVYDPASGKENLIDKHISEATRIKIPRGTNLFSLEFSVPEYTNPRRLVYAYRLSGFDSEWKTTSALLRMATYTNVPPGRYRFEVRAYFQGAPDVFSEQTVDLFVEAPWYRSALAYALYLFLFSAAGVLFFNWARQQKKRAAEKKEAQLKELRLGLFTNLTHEIRTPLNLVMAPLGTMRESEQNPSLKDTYNLMYRNCLRINRIVNQVMDLRKIDAGQMQLHFRQTDIIFFIRDIMQSFQKLAESKRIDFSLVPAREEELLWIDQGNFDKIIYNILSNAFKHTPEGGSIRVDVSAPLPSRGELAADVKEYVQICIFNSGSRIEEAWISRIFDRFVQVDPYDANIGSGVGLNLTKMLVELHHGSIQARNETDGVVFQVLVPVGKEHLTQEELSYTTHHKDLYSKAPGNLEDLTYAQEKGQEEKQVRARKNLVVVDDDEQTRIYLKSLLGTRYNVTACADAGSAWEEVARREPDAVVTDLVMPGEGGSDLCRRIRQNEATRHIPVIVLTGQNGEEEAQAASDSGADKFLAKPISVELLLSSVAQAISAREAVKDKFGVALNYDFGGIQMGSPDEKLLRRIVESIQMHLDDPAFGVATLCDEVGISRVHLNRKLKALDKESPGLLIKSLRMRQAAYLLANNQVNVSEVAYRVGFSSHSYFSSSFKEYFGMSPREFVLQVQEHPEDENLKKLYE